MTRLKFPPVRLFAAGLALALLAQYPAGAETYPTRTIKLVVGFGAGGGVDIVARLVAQKMQESLGQNVIVENRPGGNAMLGPDMVAKSAPDGYTLLYAAAGQMAVSPAIYSKIPYQPLRDFVPISMVASYPLLLIVSPNHPAKNLKDFIAWTKANPDKTNYGAASAGFQLSTELFKMRTGATGQPIVFRSTNESVTNVIGGQVTYGFAEPPPSLPQVQGGKARALAVTAPKRIPELPDVPTLHDEGIDVDVRLWSGLFAPAGTPSEIIKKLEAECMRIAQLPDFKEKLRALSSDAVGNSSAEFTKELDAEIKMWTDVARQAKLSFE
jgi:tripartite-type tricarboxylate transporter receptor subunit TctC